MKIMPSDSSSWNFLQMSKRWKLDNSGRREWKITDKGFLDLSCCGIRVDVAPVATKWILQPDMLKKIYGVSLKGIYWLIGVMNFGNTYVSHGCILYWKVKTGKMFEFWCLILKKFWCRFLGK